MDKRIYFFDTTLRDGEQSPGVSLNIEEKLDIAHQLTKLGIDVIEAGFPTASKGDFEAVKAVAQKVKGVTVAGLARANRSDIDRVWEAVQHAEQARIHTFIATSDIHLKYKLRKTRDEVLEAAIAAVKYAKGFTQDVEFSAEDAFRTDLDYLCKVLTAVIAAGATVVNIPDTVGYGTPGEFGKFIRDIRETVPNIDQAIISVHCHNDLGLAVANSLAAIENGAQQIEGTINGIGERAGNAALEEVIMTLNTRKDFFNRGTSIKTEEIYRTSKLVSSLTGMAVQSNKAIVGKNAFAHESGIHQDGVLKERTTYEIMNPAMIGITQDNIVLGKHSGRHAVREKLEQLGFNLDQDDLDKVFIRFKDLADKKKEISSSDLEALVEDEIKNVPEIYQMEYLHISTGTSVVPTATIGLRKQETLIEEAACGDGPVDAIYKAVDKVTGHHGELLKYELSAVTGGKDALGEVTVKIRDEETKIIYSGRGLSTDVLESSAKAYVNAMNKMIFDKEMGKEETIDAKPKGI